MKKINLTILLFSILLTSFSSIIGQNTVEKSLYYPVDGYLLSPAQQQELTSFLGTIPDFLHLEIVGHTDSTATSTYNQALSEKRANAVKTFCIQRGIQANKMVTSWKGESQPFKTPNDLSANRRVTITALLPPASTEGIVQNENRNDSAAGQIRDLKWLFDQLAYDWQEFYVNPNESSKFTTRGGMEFTIPNGSLPTQKPGRVKIIIKELERFQTDVRFGSTTRVNKPCRVIRF